MIVRTYDSVKLQTTLNEYQIFILCNQFFIADLQYILKIVKYEIFFSFMSPV